jgi:transcriptional regulator with XRE-family HTH domain
MSPETLRRISAIRVAAASGEAREKRKELRLTLKEVAAGIGTSESTLHRWERGETAPRGESALRWAKVLGITARAS